MFVDCEAGKLKTYTLTVTGQELTQICNGLHAIQVIAERNLAEGLCEDCIQVAHELEKRLEVMVEVEDE